MNAVIKGAKGGSKSQRQPKIANDTTASKTYARLQYGMSEGEVEGLANGFKSIFLDDTPVESDSGARNFQDVTLDFRSGTNDQTYMEGFESIASEAAVGVELKSDTPWVKGITNLNLDAVIVRVRFGALKKQDPSNGDVSGIVIDYSIEVQTDGGAWELMLDTKMSGKTSANYERTHRIGLPKANNNWLIRVTRKTPNSSSEYVSDKMYIQAITEVIDLKLTYPNTAVIGVQYDAETFSNIAKIAVDLKGVKIKVPSNYDPVSRSYSGMWDGSFKRAYTNNPAWIYYDLCTAKRYALGDRLTSAMLDKWSLYRLAQYCDQMVDDGKGGQEPRFTCNVYLQTTEDAYSILGKLAGVFRAISYWDGNSIVCDADIPQDTYFTYTRANVIDGIFEYSGTRARDRHTVAKVAWDNPVNHYKTEYVYVRDEPAIAKLGVRIAEIDAWGCTSEGQAQRAGLWALKSEQLETRTVSFKVGLDGYIPQPGKVIEIADELFAGRANGGRISAVSANLTTITIDRDNVVCSAGDRLVVNGEDGKAQARIVSAVDGRNITVVAAFDSVAAQNVWAVDAQDLKTMKFRVMSITQDDKHQFLITALQYESAKYDAIDFGAFIDERPISIINPTVQAPVTSVLISSENMVQQGLSIETMVITWDQAQGATKYQVEWRKDDGNWIKLPITGSNSIEVASIYAGSYEARVTAISAFDVSSLPTYSNLTELSGKQGLPPSLAFLHAEGLLFGMKLTWGFPATGAFDTAYTEIQVSPDGVANIAQLGLFAYPTTTHSIQGMQPNLTQKYRGRLIDRIGNIGPWSNWVSGTTDASADKVLDLLNGQITETQLHQDLQTEIAKIDENSIAISQEAIARAAAITSEAQSRATAISTEKTERQSADSNLSQRIDIVSASAANNAAAIQTEQTARANADSSLSSQITTVAATANAKNKTYSQPTAPTTGMTAGDLWFNTANNNKPHRYSGTAWVATEDTRIAANTAAITTEQTARANADTALGSRIDTVVATASGNTAAIQTEQTARVNADSALSSSITTVQSTVNGHTASIQTQATSIDGLSAQYTVKIDAGGRVSGYGLASQPVNGTTVSQFILRADRFAIAPPASSRLTTANYAFVYQASATTINGVSVPAGLYLDSAYIKNGSIATAHIGNAQIDAAKIKDAAITTAKIGDLQVDTMNIKDNAVTVPVGILTTNAIHRSHTHQPGSYSGGDAALLDTSSYFGDIVSLTVNRSGGKCQINGFVYVQNVRAVAYAPGGALLYGTARQNYCGLILYRNGTPIFFARVASSLVVTNEVTVFYGAVSLPTFIDDAAYGNVTYTLRVGFATPIANGGIQLTPWEAGNASIMSASLSVVELKK